MFVDCMYRVPSRCCNIAYKHSTKCNSVSLNVRVWDAASSGTKCNAIQMRPNVARRLSDFATNSRAMTSQCCIVCPRVGLHAEQPGDWVAVDSLSCASMFSGDAVMRSCVRPKSWGGPIHCWSPQPKSWGGLVSPGPRGCCAYALMISICNERMRIRCKNSETSGEERGKDENQLSRLNANVSFKRAPPSGRTVPNGGGGHRVALIDGKTRK